MQLKKAATDNRRPLSALIEFPQPDPQVALQQSLVFPLAVLSLPFSQSAIPIPTAIGEDSVILRKLAAL